MTSFRRKRNDQPGVRRALSFQYDEISTCSRISGNFLDLRASETLTYVKHVSIACLDDRPSQSQLVLDVPLVQLARRLTSRCLRAVVKAHGIRVTRQTTMGMLIDLCDSHTCSFRCAQIYSLFLRSNLNQCPRALPIRKIQPPSFQRPPEFNLLYPSTQDKYEMVREWTDRISSANLRELPCGVCGRNALVKNMEFYPVESELLKSLSSHDCDISRKERKTAEDVVNPLAGPILCPAGVFTGMQGKEIVRVCAECHTYLSKSIVPELALVSGQWIGELPDELAQLNLVEKLCVALYRHNNCVLQVKMGQRKLSGNAVIFSQPVNKFYNVLPPRREELEECLVVVFVGKKHPTLEDFRRTPLLIRKDVVLRALQWLKLNHRGYANVTIDASNLDSYPTEKPPVEVRYICKEGRENPENVAVFDTETERGTEEGFCTISVQGLSGAELVTMTRDERMLYALQHIDNEGQFISYGRSSDPQSMYHNPELYPGLFPWLFPYGLGGFENSKLTPKMRTARSTHIKRLISYHDRRFQTDEYFLPIVFSQQQIRDAVTGGHLATNRRNVNHIARSLLTLDLEVLSGIIRRGKEGLPTKPENAQEQQCYDLLSPIRSVDGHVQGSLASKRYQRNELHSLVMQRGMPFFFITFSPVDIKSPICLYYCGEDGIDLDSPLITLPSSVDRSRLIAGNPVACSRFFHLMVTMFVEILLAPGSSKNGLFGPTDSYYGTVESQGRLTLHLHTLLWIKGSLSPSEMKHRLLADRDGYRQRMFDWLDNTLQANFSTGSLSDVQDRILRLKQAPVVTTEDEVMAKFLEDPCCGLPPKPPGNLHGSDLVAWKNKTDFMSDVIALFSNQHKHGLGCDWSEGGICRARFPRFERDNHEIEPDTGFLFLRQKEEMLNHYSPTMSLLMMCNHDISLLRSGSQLKPIVAYVTDYITKMPLKTHAIFESIKSILSMKDEILQRVTGDRDISRKLLTRIVNAISSRQEIGAPLIAHYLQGYPDHYTNEKFKVVYWRTYYEYVSQVWEADCFVKPGEDEIVPIEVSEDSVVPSSRLHDYTFRPEELQDWTLYDYLKYTYVRPMSDKESEAAGDYLVHHDSDPSIRRPELLFALGHSQITTHRIQLLSSNAREYILNFIGGSLPRRLENTEPTEEYACVMLIFFKPGGWRTGRELKSELATWKETFELTQFSSRAKEAMGFFNTFYESRDSRFDFSAQRRRPSNKTTTGIMLLDNYINEHAAYETEQHEAFEAMPPARLKEQLAVLTQSEGIGRSMKRILSEMTEMRSFMAEGVSSAVSSLREDNLSTAEQFIAPHKSAREWRATLQIARDKIRQSRLGHLPASDALDDPSTSYKMNDNVRNVSQGDVVIIDPASVNELCRNYDHRKFDDKPPQIIANIVMTDFNLNEGQQRSYTLITRQLNAPQPQPLRMYLGGIGGTGKSQVIKSIIAYLAARNQSHRFIVMAPTGSAAALIDGSTYHSLLGFGNMKIVNTDGGATKVKEDLIGVDLIFLDEISMVSCEDLCEISRKLSKAFPLTNEPFGGKSMIVAGDFGQLPPGAPCSHPLYSGSIGVNPHAVKGRLQKPVYGKSFWHTFTTVVILTENMRLTSMEPHDVAYATALGNLRYKRCTPQDIAVFRSRVVGIGVDASEAFSAPFRYVSILTGIKSHRDAINDSSTMQFAKEYKLPLQTLYSSDSWKSSASSEFLESTGLTPADAYLAFQQYLWTLPPAVTKNVPGRLILCQNMPVMLKYNEATELCATNGAEATVVSWDEKVGPHGRKIADTIFVKLKNPPRNVKLGDLPVNIIPIPSASSALQIKLRDDNHFNLGRKQVRIIPNFAMTDYMSQGRTRPINVVDLSRCRGHQSMYTCLSRSTCLKGTLILRDFNEKKMKGGLSGDLRREFAELEALDEYTQLRVAGKLPANCPTSTREAVLVFFARWRQTQSLLEHKQPAGQDAPPPEHDLDDILPSEPLDVHPMFAFQLQWNARHWSCAYDTAIFMAWTVLMRTENLVSFPDNICGGIIFEKLKTAFSNLMSHTQQVVDFVQIRDAWREELSLLHPARFPSEGRSMASLSFLLDTTCSSSEPFGVLLKTCASCPSRQIISSYRSYIFSLYPGHPALIDNPSRVVDTAKGIQSVFLPTSTGCCTHCGSPDASLLSPEFPSPPPFIILEIFSSTLADRAVVIHREVKVHVNNEMRCYQLVALAYHGADHFVAKSLVTQTSSWLYDGMMNDGQPSLGTEHDLSHFSGRMAHLLWYVLEDVMNSD